MGLVSLELNHEGKFVRTPIYYYQGKCEYYYVVDGDWLNTQNLLDALRLQKKLCRYEFRNWFRTGK